MAFSNSYLKIINFAPYAGIDVHDYPQSIVCRALVNRDHKITQIRCRGIYQKNCITMSAYGVWFDSKEDEKEKICSQCKAKEKLSKNIFEFETIYIDDFINMNELKNIDKFVAKVDVNNWDTLTYESLPIGRYASYEFLLNRKISSPKFEESLLSEYKAALWNSMLTAIAARKIAKKYKPDRVLTYNNLYSCNHIFSAICNKFGASQYTLHAGSHHKYRLSEMTIFKDYINQSLTNRENAWDKYRRIPLDSIKIKKSYEHVEELLKAKSPWVYSIKSNYKNIEELKRRLSIPKNARVLVATMASGDERFAAAIIDTLPPYETPFFETQLEWVNHLKKIALLRSDFYIIVRVHPREFPNKREKVLSSQAKILRKALADSPKNMVINWPEDRISLHDLLKVADVGLNATSTTGIEFLLFGIPVVIYDRAQLFSYPREFNYIADNKDEYLGKIENALNDGLNYKHIINAFRWISYRSDVVAIDISSNYSSHLNFISKIISQISRTFGFACPDLRFKRLRSFFGIGNQDKLVYAIEKNQISHIGKFQHRHSVTEYEEYKILKSYAKKYFKLVGFKRNLNWQS
jgi:hypothetical protein